MARQNMYPVPYEKNMEAYNNFGGGLNTVTSNDNLADSELRDLTNIDLAERGSLKRRGGMVRQYSAPVAGIAQGYFRYFKSDGTFEEIAAIGGQLYKGQTALPITGLSSFQGSRQVEAVQFQDKLYIATGTKLVVYDGTEAKVIVPYTPQPLEALYIGTNALSDNPNGYITDGTASVLTIMGLVPDKRYGVVNENTVFTPFVNKPTTGTVEYKFEYKKYGESTYTLFRDWSTTKTASFKFQSLGDYEIKLTARMQGTTTEEYYFIPSYKVNEDNKANQEEDTSTIHQCNRLALHWNRLVLYGDPNQPAMAYFSDLDRPDYFPTLGTLKFENERREGLTALVEFRDMLIAFTPNSIQALFGKSPQDFNRILLSNAVGCIAPYSAKVMGNYVTFLGQEGIHILKSLGYTEQRANIQKIDNQIDNIVPRETDACAVVTNGQYQITFPSQKKRLRFYHQQGVWTKDESDKLDFIRCYEWNGIALGQNRNGNVLANSGAVWLDDNYTYIDKVVFKDYDFNKPYHPKKLKEVQLLLAHFGGKAELSISVFADGASVLDPDSSYASVNEYGEVIWNIRGESNLVLESGTTFGSWILGESPFGGAGNRLAKFPLSGKAYRIRLEILNSKANPNHILGMGFIYKTKKP